MNQSIRSILLAILFCFVMAGCSSDELQNVTGNASQEELDNYNALIEQAEREMQGDGEVEELKE